MSATRIVLLIAIPAYLSVTTWSSLSVLAAPKPAFVPLPDTKSLPISAGGKPFPTLPDLPQPKGSPTPVAPPSPRKTKDAGRLSVDGKELSASALESISFLINRTKRGGARDTLRLNRAQARFFRAKRNWLDSKLPKPKESDRKLLEAARQEADEVEAEPGVVPKTRDRAAYLSGVVQVYLDRPDLAQQSFLHILERNPKFEKAGTLGVYIAETYFDQGKFNEAVATYRGYYPVMTVGERQLSLYKLAWSYLNLNQPANGESCFRQLIKNFPKSEFARDSSRDLAFVICHFFPQRDFIALSDELFTRKEDQVHFLDSIRRGFEAQNDVAAHEKAVTRLLTLDSEPHRQLELRISLVKMHRQTYASLTHLAAFNKLREYLDSSAEQEPTPGAQAAALKEFLEPLELEVGVLIRNYADVFAGRIKPPETITREQQGTALLSLFDFSNKYLPASKSRPAVLALELDVCSRLEDWNCVVNTANTILAERKRFGALAQRAVLDRLVAYERYYQSLLQAKAGGKDKQIPHEIPEDWKSDANLVQAQKVLVDGTAAFYREEKASPEWVKVSTRYSDLLMEDKHYEENIPVAEAVYAAHASADILYRIEWSRFQLGHHSEVLEDKRTARFEKDDSRFRDLKREAALELAKVAGQANDSEAYRKHVDSFVKLADDPKKARIARREYLAFVAAKEKPEKLAAALVALPPGERFQPEYASLVTNAWNFAVMTGDTTAARQLLSQDNPDSGLRRAFTEMVGGKVPTSAALKKLKKEERNAVLGVVVQARPGAVLDIYDDIPPKDAYDHALAELALRLSEDQLLLAPSARAQKLLGRQYKFARAAQGGGKPLWIEGRFGMITYPTTKMSAKRYETVVGGMVGDVRFVRGKVAKAIKDAPVEARVRVLRAAAEMEKKAGQAITDAPRPAGLTEAQQKEYDEGIAGVAAEFKTQEAEFSKMVETINGAVETEMANMKASIPPQPKSWVWPSGAAEPVATAMTNARKHAEGGDMLSALALVELCRQQPNFPADDYFRLRAGILLARPASEVLRQQLAEELRKNGQDKLLDEWKKATI